MTIRDRIKDFRRIKASELSASPKNWRTHPESQVKAIDGILAEIGYADALLARELPDGSLELIDGHCRKELTPDQEVPVLIVDLDEDEAAKLMTVLDPLAAMAEVNKDALGKLLANVQTDSDALHAMLKSMAVENGIDLLEGGGEELDAEPQIDRAAELQKEWQTERGQLWEIPGKAGTHRVLCGDSTSEEDVERLIDNAVPFIMVTDPPYGVEYDPKWRLDCGLNKEHQTRAEGKVANDDQADWTAAYKLFPGHVAYVWHAGRFAAELMMSLYSAKFQIRTQIIWRKPSLVIGRGHYHWQHEPCWYAVRSGGSAKWCGDRTQSTVWDIKNMHRTQGDVDDGKTVHSTQKPVECMARPIRNHGSNGDNVYDPFLGSGTTLIAAEQLGRVCYGVEISPAYTAVILQRAKDIGLTPRLT